MFMQQRLYRFFLVLVIGHAIGYINLNAMPQRVGVKQYKYLNDKSDLKYLEQDAEDALDELEKAIELVQIRLHDIHNASLDLFRDFLNKPLRTCFKLYRKAGYAIALVTGVFGVAAGAVLLYKFIGLLMPLASLLLQIIIPESPVSSNYFIKVPGSGQLLLVPASHIKDFLDIKNLATAGITEKPLDKTLLFKFFNLFSFKV